MRMGGITSMFFRGRVEASRRKTSSARCHVRHLAESEGDKYGDPSSFAASIRVSCSRVVGARAHRVLRARPRFGARGDDGVRDHRSQRRRDDAHVLRRERGHRPRVCAERSTSLPTSSFRCGPIGTSTLPRESSRAPITVSICPWTREVLQKDREGQEEEGNEGRPRPTRSEITLKLTRRPTLVTESFMYVSCT